jgi:hypothetical protein
MIDFNVYTYYIHLKILVDKTLHYRHIIINKYTFIPLLNSKTHFRLYVKI